MFCTPFISNIFSLSLKETRKSCLPYRTQHDEWQENRLCNRKVGETKDHQYKSLEKPSFVLELRIINGYYCLWYNA